MANQEVAGGEWFEGMPEWRRSQRILARLIGVFFGAMIAAAPLTWLFARPVKMPGSVPPPEWSLGGFRRGDVMRHLELHVKESSWVTFELRGRWNECLWATGLLENRHVIVGQDGWMYFEAAMRWDPQKMAATQERRRAVMREALAMTREAGIHLLVVPTPDKVTIYPEFLPPDHPPPPGRERLYDEILADLQAAGLDYIDVRGLLLAHKASHPEQLLYYQRDTHWGLEAMLLTASAVQQRLMAEGWLDLVTPAPDIVVAPRSGSPRVLDLVRMLGLRIEDDASVDQVSAVVRPLLEEWVWRPVHLQDAAGQHPLPRVHDAAVVALCGTSCSEVFGPQLVGTLGALVDRRCVVAGGGSFTSMRKLVAELGKNGFAPKIVIWEFVQRDYTNEWMTVESLLK